MEARVCRSWALTLVTGTPAMAGSNAAKWWWGVLGQREGGEGAILNRERVRRNSKEAEVGQRFRPGGE